MNRKPDSITATAIKTITGVDESTSMTFMYDTIPAVLFSSMAVKTLNKAYIFGEKGFIEIPDFFKATAANLYDTEQQLITSFADSRNTIGYNFEIQEATDCMLEGKNESETVPHSRSNELQEIMTEVRRQIKFTYPMEAESFEEIS